MTTVRQQIMELLADAGPLTPKDISKLVSIPEKEVFAHLPHVAKSASGQGKKLVIDPPRCVPCGYVFETRKKYGRPSRCPKCKNERVTEPAYRIE